MITVKVKVTTIFERPILTLDIPERIIGERFEVYAKDIDKAVYAKFGARELAHQWEFVDTEELDFLNDVRHQLDRIQSFTVSAEELKKVLRDLEEYFKKKADL